MFGRRKKAAPAAAEPSPRPTQPEDGPITLTMRQVYELSYAAFQARAFPDAGNSYNAQRICWLEARGLPAMIPLIDELTKPDRGLWNTRGPKPGPDNQLVFDCPFITGVMIGEYIDELVHPDPQEIKGIKGPSSPILLLPRIAEHAAKIGEPVEMFFKVDDPPRFGARCVTDGNKLFFEGDVRAMLFGWGISLSRLGGPMPPEAHGAVREEIKLNSSWLTQLADFIARDETDDHPTL